MKKFNKHEVFLAFILAILFTLLAFVALTKMTYEEKRLFLDFLKLAIAIFFGFLPFFHINRE